MRVAWVVGLAAVGLLVGGCGSFAPGASAPPAVGDASQVDMCTILTDAELSGLGIELDTRKPVDRLGEVGCGWVGEPFTLDLERGEDTVAEYAARRNDRAFVTFAENMVNGRAGVRFGVSKSGQDCAQLIDGGAGVVVGECGGGVQFRSADRSVRRGVADRAVDRDSIAESGDMTGPG
ncbi:MAG: DUF3558 family protein [Pseudonocardiaceae bacterium]